MNKLLALTIALIFLLPLASLAEQNNFELEGEWYCTSAYTNLDCYKAELREDGCYYLEWNDEVEIVFHEDGQIDHICTEEYTDFRSNESRTEVTTETEDAKFCRLSDDACLFYGIVDNELNCYYFIRRDNEWIVYPMYNGKLLLFLNGRAIPYTDGDPVEYYISGNHMYLIQEDQYVRGEINPHGEFAFVFDVDTDPWIDTHGEIEINYGTPFCLFINTTAL